MKVPIDLTNAESDRKSYFTEGNIVIVEGEYKGKYLHVSYISHPPLAPKQNPRDMITNDNFGAYSYLKEKINSEHEILSKAVFENLKEPCQDENETIVVVSCINLDDENDIKSLNEMFAAYEQMPSITTFIFCGEFISHKKVDSGNYDDIRMDYKQLADTIKKYDRLKTECRFILVPSINDVASDGILPSMQCTTLLGDLDEDIEYDAANEEFTYKDFNGIKHITFATNPCRINYFGKQIVVCRYNFLKKFKKNAIYIGGDHHEGEGEGEEEEDVNGKILIY